MGPNMLLDNDAMRNKLWGGTTKRKTPRDRVHSATILGGRMDEGRENLGLWVGAPQALLQPISEQPTSLTKH